jgi:transposase-like protein
MRIRPARDIARGIDIGDARFEKSAHQNTACGVACGSLAKGMTKISYKGYRFPPEIIQQAIWLYLRFTLSFRDVEDLLAERGIIVSYETVRRWVNHFGPMIAADLRKRRPKPHATWHLDEVYLKIDGRMVYLWRAVDAEGEVLDVLVQAKRNKRAALKLMRKLLKKYGFVPDKLVTDDLKSPAHTSAGKTVIMTVPHRVATATLMLLRIFSSLNRDSADERSTCTDGSCLLGGKRIFESSARIYR